MNNVFNRLQFLLSSSENGKKRQKCQGGLVRKSYIIAFEITFTPMAYAPVEVVFGHDNASHALLFTQNLPITPVNTHTHHS